MNTELERASFSLVRNISFQNMFSAFNIWVSDLQSHFKICICYVLSIQLLPVLKNRKMIYSGYRKLMKFV